jgi:hypothetical protein
MIKINPDFIVKWEKKKIKNFILSNESKATKKIYEILK